MPAATLPPRTLLSEDASHLSPLVLSDPHSDLFGVSFPSASSRSRRVSTPPPLSATGSEFGEFISVPASEDPLAPPLGMLVQEPEDIDTRARAEADRNLLDEILHHQDDPMYFHNLSVAASHPSSHSNASSQGSEPPPQAPLGAERPPYKRQASASVLAHVQQLADTPFDLLRDLSEASLTPLSSPSTSLHTRNETLAPHTRSPSNTEIRADESRWSRERADVYSSQLVDTLRRHPARQATFSPSSPPRLSLPELSRTESMSSSMPSSPSLLADSLLSLSASASITHHLPRAEHAVTMPISKQSATMSTHSRASTIGRATDSAQTTSNLTHGTPFASHTFVPASGAPGFAGDREWNKGFDFNPDGDGSAVKHGVQLIGRNSTTAEVLFAELADLLRPHLPALARLPTTWQLLFSLDQHGISLQTLYTRCSKHKGSTVVAVRDGEGGIFGAWLGEGIHTGRGESFFGSGESFLWRVKDSGVDVFKWTGKNDYVTLCEREYIAIGGGDGTYGLYLDESLFDGSSARCPTFENDILCKPSGRRKGRTEGFECVGVEVWGVEGK